MSKVIGMIGSGTFGLGTRATGTSDICRGGSVVVGVIWTLSTASACADPTFRMYKTLVFGDGVNLCNPPCSCGKTVAVLTIRCVAVFSATLTLCMASVRIIGARVTHSDSVSVVSKLLGIVIAAL